MEKEKRLIKWKNLFILITLIFLIVLISFTIFIVTPEKIVEKIGLKNSYFVLWFFAFLGGTSILFPFPYYLFTFSFGAAGLNPLLLGISAGLGTLIGDATTYFLAYFGRKTLSKKNPKFLEKMLDIATKNKFQFMIFAFLYASFIPLSDDLIMIPAGVIKYPYKRLAISMGLGKIFLNTMIAFAGFYGWNILN